MKRAELESERGQRIRSLNWSTELDDPAVLSELRSALTVALEELPDHDRKTRAHRARRFLRQRFAKFLGGAPSGVEMPS